MNKAIFLMLGFSISTLISFSQVRLPALVSDGMVLQREAKVRIWGWASPGEKVKMSFCDSVYNTIAQDNGEWTLHLTTGKAGGPYTMKIDGVNHLEIKDILLGDVWLCSGQSNMELPMSRVRLLFQSVIDHSENNKIRQFIVPQTYNFKSPQKELKSGYWVSANPVNVPNFSAVAYFFVLKLFDLYHIPVGLINSSLGGSPVEAWISEDAIRQFPGYYDELQKFKDDSYIRKIETGDRARSDEWYRELHQKDEGLLTHVNPWYNPAVNTSDWQVMKVPGYWPMDANGPVNGVVWFRKDLVVPASMTQKPAKLFLGRIVDADSVYLNGDFVATTSYQYPPRWYTLPANVLKEGKNTLVVRIINSAGRGGFVPDKPYEIIAGDQKIDLKGDWQYRLGARMKPLAGQTFIRWKPVGLFNAMIAPITNYAIKGVIWYQGESNTSKPYEYRKLFPLMIQTWRDSWKQGQFPFLFVQLANFMETKSEPSESNWAMLRESQLKSLAVPNTGMAVIIDIGEWNDVHPLNKMDVGNRLSLLARKLAYHEKNVVCSGPIYESMQVKGNKIILSFSSKGSGLLAKGGVLKQFAIAGSDKKFVWAKAIIKGNKVEVWSEAISHPVAVRYAWADNPEGANFYNKEGLPASPFRTDEW